LATLRGASLLGLQENEEGSRKDAMQQRVDCMHKAPSRGLRNIPASFIFIP
jgi:hypothetical protein